LTCGVIQSFNYDLWNPWCHGWTIVAWAFVSLFVFWYWKILELGITTPEDLASARSALREWPVWRIGHLMPYAGGPMDHEGVANDTLRVLVVSYWP
jgi:hypothetical protein